MAELENVIKGLECCLNTGNYEECTENCPYFTKKHGMWVCAENMQRDALSLLKAQEPVKPYIDYDGQDVWRCGSCGATLFHLSHTQADENEQNCVKFCRYCGKAVKWDEPPKEET